MFMQRMTYAFDDRVLRGQCRHTGNHAARVNHQLAGSVARMRCYANREPGVGGSRQIYLIEPRRNTFNAQMVRRLLINVGIVEPRHRRPRTLPERQPDEWTIRELAETIGVPQPTLYNWVQKGRLRSRSVKAGTGAAKLVTADAATIADLKAIRATPVPWRRLPPPLRDTNHPTAES